MLNETTAQQRTLDRSLLRHLLACLRPPGDQPALEELLTAVAVCCTRFVASLQAEPIPALKLLQEELAPLVATLSPQVHVLHRRLTKYPTWALLLSLGPDTTSPIIEAVGALVADAVLRAVAVPPARARDLLEQVKTNRYTQLKWYEKLRNELTASVIIGEADTFRARLGSHYRSLNFYAGEHRHQARWDNRTLSADRLELAMRGLRARVEAGDTGAALQAVCVLTGLTRQLGSDLPITGLASEDQGARLELECGVYHLDLDVIAPSARSAPAHGVIQASRRLVRPLPRFLTVVLTRFRALRPESLTLGELLSQPAVSDSAGVCGDFDGGFQPTVARVQNSIEPYLIRLGISRVLVAQLSGRYQSTTKSKLYYALFSREDIWSACEQGFEALGWGAPTPLVGGLAIGAQAVADDQTVCDWFVYMQTCVNACRPGRRYTLKSLIEHHGIYARIVASIYVFCVAHRESHPIPLLASKMPTGQWCGVLDKRSPSAWAPRADLVQPHCVPVCHLLSEQMAAWQRHCAALMRRLIKLACPETFELVDALAGIVNQRAVPAIVACDPNLKPLPLGTQDLRSVWPSDFTLPGNWPRAYWQSRLLKDGVSDSAIDLLLRHTQSGTRPLTSTAGLPLQTQLTAVRTSMDHVLVSLGMTVIGGLVQ